MRERDKLKDKKKTLLLLVPGGNEKSDLTTVNRSTSWGIMRARNEGLFFLHWNFICTDNFLFYILAILSSIFAEFYKWTSYNFKILPYLL